MELSDQLASFEKSVEELQVALGSVDTPDVLPDTEKISRQSALLSTQFQKIIAMFSDAQLNPAVEQQIGSYQTEAHRRLRLIGIEAMRLRTAKQPTSISRGRKQIGTHVAQLQQFVQAMRTAACSQLEE